MEWNQTSRNALFVGESRHFVRLKADTDFLRLCNVLFAVRREKPIQWVKQERTIGRRVQRQTTL